mgnify:CR=1 FL=1
MKVCRGRKDHECELGNVEQPYSEFYVSKKMSDGYTNVCRTCEKLRSRENYRENRADRLEQGKAYGKNNRHVTRKASKKYYYKNQKQSIQRRLDWNKLNPDRAASNAAAYRARKRQATPTKMPESMREEINMIYSHARDCQITSGERYQVDHIVPLFNENICGLHVPCNLQVLPADLNASKGNRYGEEPLTDRI